MAQNTYYEIKARSADICNRGRFLRRYGNAALSVSTPKCTCTKHW